MSDDILTRKTGLLQDGSCAFIRISVVFNVLTAMPVQSSAFKITLSGKYNIGGGFFHGNQ